MKTFLLTWNPKKTDWDEDGKKTIDECIEEIKKNGYYENTWSCGNFNSIEKGDKVFIFRLKVKPRGLIASGIVTKDIYKDVHWLHKNKTANYIKIKYDIILNPEKKILEEKYLNKLKIINFKIQVAQRIQSPNFEKLEAVWEEFNSTKNLYPNEVDENSNFYEGVVNRVLVNQYERDSRARQQCIDKYGYNCSICGFNFEKFYGILGKDFIHVHHLVPISTIGAEYKINPMKDLIPVCPNCHAMLHKSKIVLDPEKLRKIIKGNKLGLIKYRNRIRTSF